MTPDRKLRSALKFIASFTLVTFLFQQIAWAAPLQQELPSPYSAPDQVPEASQEPSPGNWTGSNNPPLWQDFVQESLTLQRPDSEELQKIPAEKSSEAPAVFSQTQQYDYERYGFEDALEQLRPEYASAVILRELKARDLEALTQLSFEVGIAVIEGEIVLFTSGAKDEIRVSDPAKKLLERASFIAHTHPAASQEQGPSLMDLASAGAEAEYVVTDSAVFRYNAESLVSGDVETISQGTFLAHLNFEVSQNRQNQVEVRALLNEFIRAVDLVNTSPDESLVFRAGDNDVTFTPTNIRSVTSQDPNASQYEILDNGSLLHLWGNNWKAVNFGKTITANTVIEFDFRSAGALPEINSIGFSNTLTEQASTSFQIHGDQLWTGNRGVYHYLGQGDWQHYVIRAGQFFTGTFNYLMLGNDADAGQLTDVFFRNIRIYDTPTPPKFMQPFVETGGRVVIEAEHPSQGFQRSSDAWTARNSLSGFSGEGYVVTEPNNNSLQDTTFSTTSAELRYPITISSPGTYYIWVRGLGATGNDDSVHIGLNNAAVASADKITLTSFNSFVWTKNTIDGVRPSLNITTAGEHTLNVWMREDGFALDKIILTKDPNFVPSGASLAESVRVPESSGPAVVVTSAGTSSTQNYTLTYTVAGVLKTENWRLGSGVNKLTIKASDVSGRETTVIHTVTWNGPAYPEPDLSAWNALQPGDLLQMTTEDGLVLSYKDGVLMSVEKPGDYQLIAPSLNSEGDLTGGLIRYSGGSEIYYQDNKAIWLKDPRGIRYVYNADGTVREMIDTQSVKWPFAYRMNAAAAVDLISVPSSSAVTAYSGEGLLLYSLQNSGRKLFYQNGILKKVIEAAGTRVEYAIDSLSPSGYKALLISPASADYPVWIEFDAAGSITRVKRRNNDIIRYSEGLPVEVTDAQGVASAFVFNSNLAEDLTGFQVTRLGYTQTFNAVGTLTSIELPGNPEDVLNINGEATSTVKRFEIDHGKVTRVELSDGTVVDFGTQGYVQGTTELNQGTVHFTDGSRIRYAGGVPVELTTADGKIYDMVFQSAQYVATLRDGQASSSDQIARQFIYDANMKLVQLTRLNQEIIRFRNERTDEIIPNCQPGAPECADPQYFYYETDRTVSVQGAFSTRPLLTSVNTYLGFPHSVSVYDLQGQPVSIRTYEAAKLTRVDFNYGKIRKIWECNLTETACTEKFRYGYDFLENGEEVTVITDLAQSEVRRYLSDRILSYLNKDGILTTYAYGSGDRVVSSRMSWQEKEIDSFSYVYDDVKGTKKITDAKGVTRIYNQTDDKLVGVIQEGQEFVIHHFTDNGQPKTAQELVRETRDNGITYFYSMGRITRMQYADGSIVEDLIEDTNGKVFSARITHPDGSVERIVNGKKVEIVRADASIWVYEDGKLASVKDALGRETQYLYENNEIVLLTQDGARHRYNAAGQFIASQFPDSPSYLPAQGSQVFKDLSGKNQTLGTIGQAHVDTLDSRFGGASARFDGSGDYLRTDNSSSWEFGSGDFTVDLWFKPEQIGGTHALFAADYVNGTVYNGMTILPDGSLHAYFGSASTQLQSAAGAIAANRWYHAAVVRSGNTFSLYIDGKLAATRSYSGAVSNNGSEMQIGTLRFESYVQDFKGRIDEFRISKGFARWSSAFSPPEQPPVLDAYTTFLLQLGNMVPYFPNTPGPASVDPSELSLAQLDYDLLSTTLTQTTAAAGSDFSKARVVAHAGDELTLEMPSGDRLTYKAGKLIKEVEVGTEYTRLYAYQGDLTLVTESGSVKTFNAAGKLIAFKDYAGVEYSVTEVLQSGQVTAYELVSGTLKVKTDLQGKVLSVTDNGLVIQLNGENVTGLEKGNFNARNLGYAITRNESDPLGSVLTWGGAAIATNAYLGASANIAHTSDSREGVVELIDLNGDGFLDRVLAQDSNTAWKVQFNTGNGFAAAVDFGPICRAYNWVRDDYISHVSDAKETRVTLIDLNGDRKPDRVFALDGNTAWKVQWNTGTGFSELQNFGPIQRAVASVRNDYIQHTSDANELRVALMDLNGDGLPDRIQAQDGNTAWKVQFNNGTGFGALTDFGPIRRGYNWVRDDYIQHVSDAGELRVALMDLNGDKRPDRIFAQDSGAWKVQWNTGTGFSELQSFGPIQRADQSSVRYNYISYNANGSLVDLIDLNGDSLPDRLQTVSGSSQWKVQWNTGVGFSDLQNFDTVNLLNSDANYAQLKNYSGNQLRSALRDINGDGLVDRIQSSEGGTAWKVELNQSSVVGIQNAEILVNGTATTRFASGAQTLTTGTSAKDIVQFKSYALQASRTLQKTSARNFYGLKFALPAVPKNITDHEIQGTVTIQSTPLFQDASPREHSLEAVGGTIFETANAKVGTTSGRFDGIDDHIVLDDSSDWAFGSQDYTIDFWVNFDSLQGTQYIYGQSGDEPQSGTSPGNYTALAMWNNGGTYTWYVPVKSGNTFIFDGRFVDSNLTANEWHHVALVRSGNTFKLYRNGVQIGSSYTSSISIPDYAMGIEIGAFKTAGSYFKGRLDEFRISKGKALWTSAFKAEDITAGADNSTKLLLFNDFPQAELKIRLSSNGLIDLPNVSGESLRDSSASAHEPSAVGGTIIRSGEAKEGGSSGFFDGIDDRVVVEDSHDWAFGQADFTIDFYVNFDSLQGIQYIFSQKGDGNYNYAGLGLWNHGGTLKWYFPVKVNNGWSMYGEIVDNGLTVNKWYHVAVVRSGNQVLFFRDGVLLGTIAAGNYPDYAFSLEIGAFNGSSLFNGKLDEFRISKGIARWTTPFNPALVSSAPDSSTKLLLFSDFGGKQTEVVKEGKTYLYSGDYLTGSVDPDGRSYQHVRTGSEYALLERDYRYRYNAQGQLVEIIGANGLKDVSLTRKVPVLVGDVNGDRLQSRFQGASIRFDGAGDYLTFANSPDWDYGSGDFTIDTWLRLDQLNTMQEIWSQYTGGSVNNNLFFYIGADNKLSAYVEKSGATWANLTGTTSLQKDVWYHVALVREQGNLKIFLNGSLERSVPVSGAAPSGSFSVTAGATYSGSGYVYHLKGWMDELRVTRKAVWPGSSFAVPSGPSTADADTKLLLRTGKDDPSVLPPSAINTSYFKLSTANFTGPVAVIERGLTSFAAGSSAASGVLDVRRLVEDYRFGVRHPSEVIYSVFDQAGVLVYTQKLDGTLTHYEAGKVKTVWGRGGVLIQTYEYDAEGNPLKVTLHQMREDFPVKIQMAREKVEEQKLIALRNLSTQQSAAVQQIAAQFADARAKLDAQRQSLESQRYQKVCKQTLCWTSCETIEVPGVSAAIEQLNGAILDLSIREAQAYVDLQNQIAQAKTSLETEINNAFLQIDQQEINFRREIIRQEISPLIFHYYRKYLGRDANKAEYDQWINSTNYDAGFDVAALKRTLSGKDANGNTVTTSYSAELNARTASVNQIKNTVSVFLDDYALKNTADRAAMAQAQLGMPAADLVNLSQAEIQKVKTWLNSRSLHFGQSAFIALERMLAQAGISYNREILAKNLILIDILSGIITPFEEGDLLISLFAIKHYAARLGLNTTGLNASFDDLDRFYEQNHGKKMIAHINGDHYVVIEDILDVFDAESGQWIRKIKYLDPGAGAEGQNQMMEIAEADFVKVWQGNLLATVSNANTLIQLHNAAPNTGNIPPPRELSKQELQKVRGAFFFFLIPFIVAIVVSGDKIIKDTWNYIKQSLQNLAVSFFQLVTGDIAGFLRTTIQQMSNTLVYAITLFTDVMGSALSLIPYIGEPIGNFVKSAGQKITGLIQKGTQVVSNFLTKAAPVINFFSKWTPTNPETLKKLGFSDKMANYVSQAITVVVITVATGGNLPIALAAMAASIAVQEIGPRVGLSPQLTQVLSMVASAAAGAGVGSIGSGTFAQALKHMAPNLAGGLAQVGIMAVGSAIGLDWRLTQVLSVPFALGAGGFVKGAFSGASGLGAAFAGAKNAIINGAVGGLISAGASIAGVPPVFNGLLSGLLGQIAGSSGGNSGQGSSLVGQSLFGKVADNFKRFGGAIADAAGNVVSFGQKVLEGVGTVTKAGFSKALDFFSGAFDRPTQEKLRTAGNGSIENAFLNSDFLQLDANLYQAVVHFGGEDITVRYDKGIEKITLLSASSERTLTGAVKDQAGNYFGNTSLKDYWANGQYAVQNFNNTLGSFGVFSASDELLLEISPLDTSTPISFFVQNEALLTGKLTAGQSSYTFDKGNLRGVDNVVIGDNNFMNRLLPPSLPLGEINPFSKLSLFAYTGPNGLISTEFKIPNSLRSFPLDGFTGLSSNSELLNFAHRFIDDAFVSGLIDLKNDVSDIIDQPHINGLAGTLDIQGGLAQMAAGAALATGGTGALPFTGGASFSATALGFAMISKGVLDIGAGLEKISQSSGVNSADYLTLDDLIGDENSRVFDIVEGIKNRYDESRNLSNLTSSSLGGALIGAARLFVDIVEYYEDNYYGNYSNN